VGAQSLKEKKESAREKGNKVGRRDTLERKTEQSCARGKENRRHSRNKSRKTSRFLRSAFTIANKFRREEGKQEEGGEPAAILAGKLGEEKKWDTLTRRGHFILF